MRQTSERRQKTAKRMSRQLISYRLTKNTRAQRGVLVLDRAQLQARAEAILYRAKVYRIVQLRQGSQLAVYRVSEVGDRQS